MEKENLIKQWVKDHSDLLYNYTLRRGVDSEMAKDIVQESFLAAWRNIDNYKGEASVKNWLFIILKNKITDHFRKSVNKVVIDVIQKEYQGQQFFDSEDHWNIHAYPKQWALDMDNVVEKKEFYNVLSSCSKKLKEIQNNVFVMKYVDGLKSEDICKALNISPSNYWVIIHRAKVQLRACLEKNWL